MVRATVIEAFHARYIPEPNTGCWLWEKEIRNNYPIFKAGPVRWSAHRFSYSHFKGPIPAGLRVCHTCDVPSCVNPEHLWLGTDFENINDSVRKDRMARGERHHRSKLTEEAVVEIRKARGVISQRELGLMYGVSKSTIRAVLQRKTWKRGRQGEVVK